MEHLEHVSNSLCACGGPEELKKVRSFLSEAPTHAHSEQALNVLNRAPCNEGKDRLFAPYVVGYCVRQMSLDTLQILFFTPEYVLPGRFLGRPQKYPP